MTATDLTQTSILLWNLSDISISGTDQHPFANGDETGKPTSDIAGGILSIADNVEPVCLTIKDNDNQFNDGDGNQTLLADVELGVHSGKAGDRILPEYSYAIRPKNSDDPSDVITVYAVELSSSAYVGIVSDKPLTVGADYVFIERLSTIPSVSYTSLTDTYATKPPATDNRATDLSHISLGPSSIEDLKDVVDAGNVYSASGFENNLNNPQFGTAHQPFIRITENATGPNGEPRGVVDGVQTLPNEREISNLIVNQDEDNDGTEEQTSSVHGTNLLLMSFGQFFDHGLDLLEGSFKPEDVYSIPLIPDDPLYRFSDDGNPRNDFTSITIRRGDEAIDPNTGEPYATRTHINQTSPPHDVNQIYGSSDAVTYYLRNSKRDDDGKIVRDDNGLIVKLASLVTGSTDETGRLNLPTYKDILINNGMSISAIEAAIAANSFEMLQAADGFVDFRNVLDPVTGQPDGNPLMLDTAPSALPGIPGFQLTSLLSHHISGDGRNSENIALNSVHLVFFRDHEHWLNELREKTNTEWTEQELFDAAKSIVASEYQRVIYDEFIDALAGSLPSSGSHGFDGYNPRVDSQVSEEFAHAMYRVGHSMINETIPFVGDDGSLKEMSLVEAFLNPTAFEDIGGRDILVGETMAGHQRIDENIVNAVRNQLLGRPLDLGAINIARGREVGIPSLNDVRKFLYENGSAEADNGSEVTRALKGNPELKPYASWEEFASNLRDPSLVEDFKKVYNSVDDVDLWVGGLAEKNRSTTEGQMGTTFTWIFWDQMDRLQDGDRLFYKERFADTELLGAIETQTFADIIMRTTGAEHLADSVFFLSKQVRMGLAEKARKFTDETETIVGNALDNTIHAEGGNDTVYGGAGDDEIYGGKGSDGLRGEDGNDVIYGGADDDRVVGGAGDDLIWGGDDNDALNGNDGNDTIYGEAGNDYINGNSGSDKLYGNQGNDTIKGGLGDDYINGGSGKDRIETNGGNDNVWTGDDRDIILMSDDPGFVTVHDFNKNEDRVDLSIFGIRNSADLQQKITMTDTTNGVVLSVGASSLLLKGVALSDVTQDNFKFRNDDQNLVVNGRMEDTRIAINDGNSNPILEGPVPDGLSWTYRTNDESVGWKNANDDRVEYQLIRGNTVLELDADNKTDEIYQLLPTEKDEVYSISFDARERGGRETSTVEILWNGELVGKIDPESGWKTFNFEVVGTGGKDRLTFKEEAADNNNYGALLDNIIVAPKDGKPQPYTLTGNDDFNFYVDETLFSEYIDGKGGHDIFRIAANDAGYTIEKDANDYHVIKVKDEIVAGLRNVEQIEFDDAIYKLDASGNFVKETNDQSLTVADIVNEPQYLTGTGENDTFVIAGQSADYQVGPTEDGTGIIIWGPTGFDLLFGFDVIRFADKEVRADENGQFDIHGSTGDNGETVYNDTDGPQWLTGTTEKDVFVIDGNTADYGAGPTEDGKGVVVWSGDKFDILYGFDVLRFNDKDVVADENGQFNINGDPGTVVETLYDNVAGPQWLLGNSDNDVFVVGDDKDGYTVEKTQDGQDIVVWKGDDFDILYDFETVRFNDEDVTLSDIA